MAYRWYLLPGQFVAWSLNFCPFLTEHYSWFINIQLFITILPTHMLISFTEPNDSSPEKVREYVSLPTYYLWPCPKGLCVLRCRPAVTFIFQCVIVPQKAFSSTSCLYFDCKLISKTPAHLHSHNIPCMDLCVLTRSSIEWL